MFIIKPRINFFSENIIQLVVAVWTEIAPFIHLRTAVEYVLIQMCNLNSQDLFLLFTV